MRDYWSPGAADGPPFRHKTPVSALFIIFIEFIVIKRDRPSATSLRKLTSRFLRTRVDPYGRERETSGSRAKTRALFKLASALNLLLTVREADGHKPPMITLIAS